MQTNSSTRAAASSVRLGSRFRWWAVAWALGVLLPCVRLGAATTLGLWQFDEGSGTVAQDGSGHTNHGTVQGATWVAHQAGSALSFRGGPQTHNGDGVQVPHSPALAIAGPFYVEAWIRARGTNHYGAIVDKHIVLDSRWAGGFTLYLTGGELRFGTYCGTRGNSDLFVAGEMRDNLWHHVMGGWDGTNLYLHVDGDLVAEAAWPHAPALSTAALGIGKRYDGWGGFLPFEGEIDAVRLYGSPFEGGNVAGRVDLADASGRIRGPLEGCSVLLDGQSLATTDARGEFRLPAVVAGDHELGVRKDGHYPTTRPFTLGVGESRFDTLQLVAQTGGTTPVAFDFRWPRGYYYLAGLPGTLALGCTVAWNGAQGSVQYLLGEATHLAALNDLGDGVARAELKALDIPGSLAVPVELLLKVTNGQGSSLTICPGIYFHPLPRLLRLWFGTSPAWAISDPGFDFSESVSLTFWDAKVPGGIYESSASLGLGRSMSLDTQAGTGNGSLSGFGSFSHSMDVPGVPVEVLGEGRLELGGAVDLTFQGLSPLVMTPSWSASFLGKAGIGVPVVVVVNVVAPGLGSTLSELPGLGDVKLRLFEIGGLGLAGEYAGGKSGDCFLGTTSLTFSGTLGLEAQLVLDLDELDVETGVYVGATGTPEFLICPEFAFQGITFRGYAGVFASAWLFEWEKEVGVEVRFEPGSGLARTGRSVALAHPVPGLWKPIGTSQSRWGFADRPPTEQPAGSRGGVQLHGPGPTGTATVRENVSQLARPALCVLDGRTRVFFVTQDPAKPWYGSTDIAVAEQGSDGLWSCNPLTSDLAAEFNPSVAAESWGLVAAWERVAGDASRLTRPDQVAPLLEIVTCFYDAQAKVWTEPVALTSNTLVDRSPVVVTWTEGAGVLWIQNRGVAPLGTTASGDRVCFAATAATGGWEAPVTLWEGPQGALDLTVTSDPDGVLYAAWVVDEDGDPATREDREVYTCTAFGRVWGTPVRLTHDAVEDADPKLAYVNRSLLFVWRSEDRLTFTKAGIGSPRPIHSTRIDDTDVPITLTAMPDSAALLYPLPGPTGVDVVVCTYDADLDQWSAPRPLTADADVEHSIAAVHDGSNLTLACLSTQTIRTNKTVVIDGQTVALSDLAQPGRTDLRVWRRALGMDPAVQAGSLRMEPVNPAPGATCVIHVIVENRGELTVRDLKVGLFDGDPQAGGTPIGLASGLTQPLEPGGSQPASLSWVVPLGSGGHQIIAHVDPNLALADRDRSNNFATLWMGLPDLAVETASATAVETNHVLLVARVGNHSVTPTPKSSLAWRLGTADGPVIARQPLAGLKPGGVVELSWLWEPAPSEVAQNWATLVAEADDGGAIRESDESNNQRRVTARVVASWVPCISGIRCPDAEHIALEFVAPNAVASELEIETTEALTGVISWHAEVTATITSVGPTAFAATLLRPDHPCLFRVKLTPK